jgi:hypothetical protein
MCTPFTVAASVSLVRYLHSYGMRRSAIVNLWLLWVCFRGGFLLGAFNALLTLVVAGLNFYLGAPHARSF